jgi:glutathione synthase/RimK-type ligase-like ATP-grasp enzyme
MILIITNKKDFTADFLIVELGKQNIEFHRFNTEDFPQKANFVYSHPSNGNSLCFSDKKLMLSDITSIWYRRPVSPEFDTDTPINVKDFVTNESKDALLGLWRTINCLWVNHPDKNRLAENKIEQIDRAHSHGFQIPPTLVTNKPDSASDFIKTFNGEVIAKTLRQSFVSNFNGKSIIYTNIVDNESLESIERVKNCPVIFQQFIKKKSDIRINVFGDEVYATELCSQQSKSEKIRVDWRRAKIGEIEHKSYCLSEDMVDRIIKFTRSYGLEFGALDFVLSTKDELIFLELNPNGQWGWIEQLTKQPLRKALIKLLTQNG